MHLTILICFLLAFTTTTATAQDSLSTPIPGNWVKGTIGAVDLLAGDGKPKPLRTPGPPTVIDERRAELYNSLQTQLKGILACYDPLLKQHPELNGTMTCQMEIRDDGTRGNFKVLEDGTGSGILKTCVQGFLAEVALPEGTGTPYSVILVWRYRFVPVGWVE